jgi:hypothetical protein
MLNLAFIEETVDVSKQVTAVRFKILTDVFLKFKSSGMLHCVTR